MKLKFAELEVTFEPLAVLISIEFVKHFAYIDVAPGVVDVNVDAVIITISFESTPERKSYSSVVNVSLFCPTGMAPVPKNISRLVLAVAASARSDKLLAACRALSAVVPCSAVA